MPWDGLLPNSIAVLDEENIFVGMQGGVVKLNLLNNETKFYKYNNIVMPDEFHERWDRLEKKMHRK